MRPSVARRVTPSRTRLAVFEVARTGLTAMTRAQKSSSCASMEDDRVPGPRVNITHFLRAREDAPYESSLRQEGVEIYDRSEGIGWWFPGADASLDKVVIDGVTYTHGDDGWPKGSDTVVREGSEVESFKTALDEFDEEEEDER